MGARQLIKMLSLAGISVLIAFFSLVNLMAFVNPECPAFGITLYDALCLLLSLLMFGLGLSFFVLYLAGARKTASLVSTVYFAVTFLEAWTWVNTARLLTLIGLGFSILLYSLGGTKTVSFERILSSVSTVVFSINYVGVFIWFYPYIISYASYRFEALYPNFSSLYLALGIAVSIPAFLSPLIRTKRKVVSDVPFIVYYTYLLLLDKGNPFFWGGLFLAFLLVLVDGLEVGN
ncbi:hypothetical protein [Thermococcus sp.]